LLPPNYVSTDHLVVHTAEGVIRVKGRKKGEKHIKKKRGKRGEGKGVKRSCFPAYSSFSVAPRFHVVKGERKERKKKGGKRRNQEGCGPEQWRSFVSFYEREKTFGGGEGGGTLGKKKKGETTGHRRPWFSPWRLVLQRDGRRRAKGEGEGGGKLEGKKKGDDGCGQNGIVIALDAFEGKKGGKGEKRKRGRTQTAK